ncbi:DNRLRE domain-containing protein, partial [Candidatus Viridilinea mediisalina]|uniref:DNRLRE domain-containing protein n=1 Tax=Candidatus Viridilinea mediisalina TaxID=2024553 RepID=UPI000F5922BC
DNEPPPPPVGDNEPPPPPVGDNEPPPPPVGDNEPPPPPAGGDESPPPDEATGTPDTPVTDDNRPVSPIDDGFIELDGARTPYSRVFLGEQDGRTVARIQRFFTPVDFYDAASDSWLPIDTTLVASPAGYRNAAADFEVTFAAGSTERVQTDRGPPLLTLGRPGEAQLAKHVPSGSIPEPIVATNSITYPAALAGSDLVYHVVPWGIKEEIVLHSAAAPASYELLLDLDGASVMANGTAGWLVQDAAGENIWRILPPIGYDAAGATTPLQLEFTPQADGRYSAVLSADPAWLNDPARVYPVRLDPTFANPSYVGGETYVQSLAATTISYNQRARYLGYSTSQGPKGFNRIYVPVDLSLLPAGLREEQLLGVQVVLSQYVTESSGAGFATSAHVVPTAWFDLTLHWNNQPAQGARISGTLVSPVLEHKRWDVTTWARDVLGGRHNNHGIMIRADNESGTGDGAGIFWSSHCGNFCPNPTINLPMVEYTIGFDSGLNPWLDTWAWRNRSGITDFEQFVRDYGLEATTHLITETRLIQTFSTTEEFTLPVSFEPIDLNLSIPLSITNSLSMTEVITDEHGMLFPRPIAYAYEEVLVRRVFDDPFAEVFNATMEGGLCLGMAATVGDLQREDGPRPVDYGGELTVESIPDAEASQEYIQTIHGRQLGSQAMNWLATPGLGQLTVNQYYQRLLAMIGTAEWQTNPEVVGIISGGGCDDLEIGHALLPYKLIWLPNNQARVYVYDPNYPPASAADADNRFITLDLANNTWSYSLAQGVQWQGRTIFSTPLSILLEEPILPTASGSDMLMVQGGHSLAFGGHSLAFGGHSLAFGEDGTNTHTGCYVSSDGQVQLTQEISRSYRVVPLSGSWRQQVFPNTLFMPAGQPLSFNGYGSRDGGVGDMLVFGPHAMVGALSTVEATSRDRLSFDAAFLEATMTTADSDKPVTLYQVRESDDWSRVYAVSNTSLAAGEELRLAVSPDFEQLILFNNAPRAKRFDLGFAHIGNDGIGQITHRDQEIEAGATIIYTPLPWHMLPDAPILVEIDENSNGTIDHVELLGGTVLPVVAPVASIPTTPGAMVELLTHNERAAPGDFGWVAPQWVLWGGEPPTRQMRGNHTTLRAWLEDPEAICIGIGAELVGVPGTHGGLIRSITAPPSDPAGLSFSGQVVIVPLYDRTVIRRGGLPNTYHLGGFAVVRILSGEDVGGDDADCKPQQGCRKVIRGELLALKVGK